MFLQMASVEVENAGSCQSVPSALYGGNSNAGKTSNVNSPQPDVLDSESCVVEPSEQGKSDLWGLLVDPDSPSMPCSPGAHANSPPDDPGNMIWMTNLELAPPAPQLSAGSFQSTPAQQPNEILAAQSSSGEAKASQHNAVSQQDSHAEHAEVQNQQHSTDSRRLGEDQEGQQSQPASAGQQLQWQLQQSQQQLLHFQKSRKQRISDAYEQCVTLETISQLSKEPQALFQTEADMQRRWLIPESHSAVQQPPQLWSQPHSGLNCGLYAACQGQQQLQQQRAQAVGSEYENCCEAVTQQLQPGAH